MKTRLLVGALIVLVIMNLAALGTFWYMHHNAPYPPRGDRMEWRMRHGGGERLTREERRRVRGAMRSLHREIRPLIEQTDSLEGQLIEALKKDPIPRARIDSLHQQIAEKRLEIAKRATDHMIAMSDSLTPAERAHMVDAMARFRRGGFGPGERRHWRRD